MLLFSLRFCPLPSLVSFLFLPLPHRLEFRDCHGEWVARHSPALHEHVAARVRSAAEGVILPPEPTDAPASKPGQAPGAPEGGPGAAAGGAENGGVGLGSDGGKGVAEIEETQAEKFLRAQALKVKEELRQALNKELEVRGAQLDSCPCAW